MSIWGRHTPRQTWRALMATARTRLRPGQGEFDLSVGPVPVGQAVITGKRHAVLWQVLTSAYARLGFDGVGDAAFAQLVLARIIEPTSKVDSLRVLDELGIAHASLRTMVRTLGRVGAGGTGTRSQPRVSPTPPRAGTCRCVCMT